MDEKKKRMMNSVLKKRNHYQKTNDFNEHYRNIFWIIHVIMFS